MGMKRAMIALAVLGLMVFGGPAVDAQVETKVEFRGSYFVSIEGHADSLAGDTILFPKKQYGIETFVTTPDSSTAVTSVKVRIEEACTIRVWTDAAPSGVITTITLVERDYPFVDWYSGFKGGIDSLQIIGTTTGVKYAVWGMI